MYLSAVLRDEQSGEVVGLVAVPAHTFKTGSTGFYGSGKVTLADGARCQVTVTVVRIGSRGEAERAEVLAEGGQAAPVS